MGIIIIVWFFCVVLGGVGGNQRKIGAAGGVFICLILGIVGLIIVACSPLIHQPIDTYESKKMPDAADELIKWHNLKEKGIITEEEYETKKKMYI